MAGTAGRWLREVALAVEKNETERLIGIFIFGSRLIGSWVISPQDRAQHERTFYSLGPINGKLSGEPCLIRSVLFISLKFS